MTYKVNTLFELDAPKFGTADDFVTWHPEIIDLKWTRNTHLMADELTVTIPWQQGGTDPRILKAARCGLWIWDANREDLSREHHLRFTGICTKAGKKLSENGYAVDLAFQDFTNLFIACKPLRTEGMPKWSDTLDQIWDRICDNTGVYDPDNDRVISSVAAFKKNLKPFGNVDISIPIGSIVPSRFHKISQPTPKKDASSWDVWQWCVCSLGLISYIDRDECIVTNTTEHFSERDAPRVMYGHNIHTLEESVDTTIARKGVLIKSFDTLRGQVLEAFYPRPGDERLKSRKAFYKPKSDGGAAVTANEQSGDYMEFEMHQIQDQAALDRAARDVYEQISRQEMEVSIHTAEMVLDSADGETTHDIMSLRAGDPIVIDIDPSVNRDLLLNLGGLEERVQYLRDHCDYDEDVARLIATNLDVEEIASKLFHVKTIEVALGPESFDVDIKAINKISIP